MFLSISVLVFGIGFLLFLKGFKFLTNYNSKTVPSLLNELEETIDSHKQSLQKDTEEITNLKTQLKDSERLKEELKKFRISCDSTNSNLEQTLKKVSALEAENGRLRSQTQEQDITFKNRIARIEQEKIKEFSDRMLQTERALQGEREKAQAALQELSSFQEEQKRSTAQQPNDQPLQDALHAIEQLKREKEERRAEYAASLLELKEINKNLTEQLRQLTQQRQVPDGVLKEKEGVITQLRQENDELKRGHDRMAAQLASLAEKCGTLQKENDAFKGGEDQRFLKVQEAQAQMGAFKNEKQLLLSQQEQSRLSIEKLGMQLEQVRAENNKLLSLRAAREETIKRLEKEIESARQQKTPLAGQDKAHEQALVQKKQQEIDSLRQANDTIRQTHEQTFEELRALREEFSSLEKQLQERRATDTQSKTEQSKEKNDELAALRAENEELKKKETQKFLRMKEISNNFKRHIETFEHERYELQQKISDLEKKVLDTNAQVKNTNKNEFLSREQLKEIERLLSNKTNENEQLRKEMEIIVKENEALKNKELESESSIKNRLKDVVKDLKSFSDSLSKEKKELSVQIEKLDKNVIEKEKKLFEKEAEIEVFKEQIEILQEEIKLKQKELLHSQGADSKESKQDLSSQTEQFLGLKADNQNLRQLFEASTKENEQLTLRSKELKQEIEKLKEAIEKQKGELVESHAARAQERASQSPDFLESERVMLEWYRTTFEERNKDLKDAKIVNLELREEIGNLREEVERLKKGKSGSSDNEEEIRA